MFQEHSNTIAEIKQAFPLLEVYRREIGGELRQRGAEYWACCPFHKEATASFSINAETNVYCCFGCGKGGDVFTFLAEVKGISSNEAIKLLADELKANQPKKPPFDWKTAKLERTHYYHDGAGAAIVKKDIHKDANGNKQAIFYRMEGGQWVKNLNGLQRPLYRLPELLAAIGQGIPLYWVEGERDADTLIGLGLVSTTLGGSNDKLQAHHLKHIPAGCTFIVLGDNDEPGRGLRQDTADKLLKHGCHVKVVDLPGINNIQTAKGTGANNGVDVSDWLAAGHTKAELLAAVNDCPLMRQAKEMPESEPWESPIPFMDYNLPSFPLHALPTWLADHVKAVSASYQTPIDLAANLALSAIAIATARSAEVLVYQDWREPLNIWTLTLLEPSNLKSPVAKEYGEPFRQYAKWKNEEERAEISAAREQLDTKKKRIEALKAAAAKSGLGEGGKKSSRTLADLENEIRQLAGEIEGEKLPVYTKLLVADITTEQLITLCCEQKGERIGILNAEGALIFRLMAGRYSKGQPNVDFYLSAWAGEPYQVDRRGRSENINKPALTMGLAAQPMTIKGLADTREYREFRDRGLLARFLYSIPESCIGRRDVARHEAVPEHIRATYQRNILALLNLPAGDSIPQIRLSPGALTILIQLRQWLEPQLSGGGELAGIQDWAGKLHGYTVRIAGLLHLAELAGSAYPWQVDLSDSTMAAAVVIGNYYLQHAKAAFSLMGESQRETPAKRILDYMSLSDKQEYTRYELYQKFKGTLYTTKALDEVLALLEDQGYIRKMPCTGGRGRKKQAYELNPITHNSHNSYKCHESSNGAACGVQKDIPINIPQISHNSETANQFNYRNNYGNKIGIEPTPSEPSNGGACGIHGNNGNYGLKDEMLEGDI